jgi:hypothetical protein
MFPEDSTWVSYQDILLTYPRFHLEDKVSLEDQGDDTNEDLEGPTNIEIVMSPQVKEKRKVVYLHI